MGRRGTYMRIKYVQHDIDRHGNDRWYYRRSGGRKIRLPSPNDARFAQAYLDARAGEEGKKVHLGASNVGASVAAYYKHNSFTGLAPASQSQFRRILEQFRAKYGHLGIATMRPQDVASILGAKKPFAARNWLKALRSLMAFAKATGLRNDDPTAGIKLPPIKTTGFHTWTEAEIEQYERFHAGNRTALLGMALVLYTAARRSDAVGMGSQNVRKGVLTYRQQKTKRLLTIPLHPKLAAILADTPTEHLAFMVTHRGKPYTASAFSKLLKRWFLEAGLPAHCNVHGLRKAQCRRLAEAGCSAPQIAAISGHLTLKEVQRYIDDADQAMLAEAAIERIAPHVAPY